jgi:tRNA/tmRNA/rRNA uracil-C5-methylase (TrmA/RlmC/RlmD family)
MQNDTVFDVDIISLVYGGDALGRLPDGRAVFVPGALPGEHVRLKLYESRPRFARGALLEVLQPAEDRIAPPHPGCPGCHYQHMTYPAQLRAKTAIVRDQFQRIAGFHNRRLPRSSPRRSNGATATRSSSTSARAGSWAFKSPARTRWCR